MLLVESRGGDGASPDQRALDAMKTTIGELTESMQAKIAQMKKDVDELVLASEYASARYADLRKDVEEKFDECKKRQIDHVTQVDRKLDETRTALRLECAPRTPLGGGQVPAEACEGQQKLQLEVERLSESLSEIKTIVAKESLSLASNIKHTSKILMDLSDLRSREEAKSKQFAHKSDLQTFAQKSELKPMESVVNQFSLNACTHAIQCLISRRFVITGI